MFGLKSRLTNYDLGAISKPLCALLYQSTKTELRHLPHKVVVKMTRHGIGRAPSMPPGTSQPWITADPHDASLPLLGLSTGPVSAFILSSTQSNASWLAGDQRPWAELN